MICARVGLAALTASVLLTACGEAPTLNDATESLAGVDPTRDQSDRGCHVVLRRVGRVRDGSGYAADQNSYLFFAELDVSEAAVAEGLSVEVAFRVEGTGGVWRSRVGSTSAVFPFQADRRLGFTRYGVLLSGPDLPAPGWSGTALSRARLELIPYLGLAGGGRLYDHNRHDSDFANYVLPAIETIEDDEAVCAAVPHLSVENPVTIRFSADGGVRADGAPWTGSPITIDYELDRLNDCRGTHNGFPAWDLIAHARFLPSGRTVSGSLRVFDAPSGVPNNNAHAVPFTVTPEAGERELELWFENYTGAGSSCRVWDSAYGANYRFSILRPPDWMGRATLRLTRDTSSACGSFPSDGLGSEVLYGTGTRQRSAIRNICFEVYQGGVTDGPASALWRMLDVRAHLSANGGGSEAWQHLPLLDRVGNNARFALDLGQVDPLRRYHCPTVPTRVENSSEIAAMALHFSVNGAVLTGPEGEPVQLIFSDYANDPWRQANCP